MNDTPRLHLIANAHLDPVWQWRWEEGAAEALSTFRSAVELLHEHENFVFNHNEAVLYRWVLEHDSGLFREIRSLIAAGRWAVFGGWDLQPDLNLTGTEGLIRHITEGRHFFRDQFGIDSVVAANFDSFGHTAGLPQILAQTGYRMYVHMRPQKEDLALPSELYRWKGVDGTIVLGYRIEAGLYHTEYDNLVSRLREGIERVLETGRDVALFWGIGNHGGGATREDLLRIDEFIAAEKRIPILHGTLDGFHEAVKAAGSEAPLFEGGLQRVFTGCYTSSARLKRRALRGLGRLIQAESLAAAAWWIKGADYPDPMLEESWRSHLFNDFHDILPGTLTRPAESDALDQYGHAAQLYRRVRLGALASLQSGEKKQIDLPLNVVNSIPSLTHVPVEVEAMISHRPPETSQAVLRVLTADGREVESQEEPPEARLPFNGWRRKVVFHAHLSPFGPVNFQLQPGERKTPARERASLLPHRLDRNGTILWLRDEAGQPVIESPIRFLTIEDRADSWGTGIWAYDKVAGCFEPEKGGANVIAAGPVRTVTESLLKFGCSRIVQQVISYSDWPVLEIRLRIEWMERHKRLKISLPTVFKKARPYCEIPGGAIERPADGQEHVHGRWLCLADSGSGRRSALGIVHDGAHGFDCRRGELRLSVLRSAVYCHERGLKLKDSPRPRYMDQGEHELRILLTAGEAGSVLRFLPGLADWLTAPPLALAHLPVAERALPVLFTSLPPSIRLLALKRSRDGKALVFRIQECCGQPTELDFRLNSPPTEIRTEIGAFELKTFRVTHSGNWREVDPLDEK